MSYPINATVCIMAAMEDMLMEPIKCMRALGLPRIFDIVILKLKPISP
jgi:hypothetical protein